MTHLALANLRAPAGRQPHRLARTAVRGAVTDWCDAVISSFGVRFFDNPAAAFTSLAAVVRPGGAL